MYGAGRCEGRLYSICAFNVVNHKTVQKSSYDSPYADIAAPQTLHGGLHDMSGSRFVSHKMYLNTKTET